MAFSKVLLAVLVLIVGLALAWRSSPLARVVLFGSALLVSALLFLPTKLITGLVGLDFVVALYRLTGRTPLDVPEWTHVLIFAWLGLLLWLARQDLRGWKAWVVMAVLAVAAELAQDLAPGREPRLDDVLLNLAGGAVGLLLAMGISWFWHVVAHRRDPAP